MRSNLSPSLGVLLCAGAVIAASPALTHGRTVDGQLKLRQLPLPLRDLVARRMTAGQTLNGILYTMMFNDISATAGAQTILRAMMPANGA